jgi:hypothetical protein
VVTAGALAFAPVLAPVAQAKQPQAPLQLPIAGTLAQGGTFEGTFTLLQFVNDNGKVMAVGTVTEGS